MSDSGAAPGLRREIGFWQGTALNFIDMVGIGPFLTLPLILAAMGGGRALSAWLLGALLAIADGLVTAELSAQMPAAGGSYAFLREAYGRERWGRLVSFLFLFQIVFSAPLSIASGAIGFSRYLRFVAPSIPEAWEAPVAALLCLLVTLGLFRRIGAIGRFSIVLWAGVLLALGIVIGVGLPHLDPSVLRFWEAPVVAPQGGTVPAAYLAALAPALLMAVYDYLGYYNICYLAEEVVEPTKTIPRVIVVSILLVAVLYLLMNVCVLSVLPVGKAMASKAAVSDYVAVAAGRPVALGVTVLILWTAFASVFSLTLGYSRILFAAARDGAFFRPFARLHPTEGYPVVALAALGGAATLFSFLDLKAILVGIISIRAVVPFIAQIAGALLLRRTQPDRPRPFKMWLYPLPALVSLSMWVFIAASPQKGLQAAGFAVMALGTAAYLLRARRRGEWPFRPAPAP